MKANYVKQIKNYPNYAVNDKGEVFNIKTNRKLKDRLMSNGYLSVNLGNEYGRKEFLVHRLVAELYIPNELNLKCVNHKNLNKTDNRVKNLEWVSYKDNTKHALNKNNFNRNGSKKVQLYNKITFEVYKSYKEAALKENIKYWTLYANVKKNKKYYIKELLFTK